MAKEIDPAVKVWREALQCLIHPHLPLTSTLIEMEDKLDAVCGFLATIDAADPQQAGHAVAVGGLAVNYADELRSPISASSTAKRRPRRRPTSLKPGSWSAIYCPSFRIASGSVTCHTLRPVT